MSFTCRSALVSSHLFTRFLGASYRLCGLPGAAGTGHLGLLSSIRVLPAFAPFLPPPGAGKVALAGSKQETEGGTGQLHCLVVLTEKRLVRE